MYWIFLNKILLFFESEKEDCYAISHSWNYLVFWSEEVSTGINVLILQYDGTIAQQSVLGFGISYEKRKTPRVFLKFKYASSDNFKSG